MTTKEDGALQRLGLSRAGLTEDAVYAAYHRLAKQALPDAGGSWAQYRRLQADRDLALKVLARAVRIPVKSTVYIEE